MNKYLVAYFNWYDEVIQFCIIEALSGLLAMEEVLILPEAGKLTEEEYCQKEIKRGGFIGYLEYENT